MCFFLLSCSEDSAPLSGSSLAGTGGSTSSGGQAGDSQGGSAQAGTAGSAITISSATREELVNSYVALVCGAYDGCCQRTGKSSKPCPEVLKKSIPSSSTYDPVLGQACLDSLAIKTKDILCSPEYVDYIEEVARFDFTCDKAFGGNPPGRVGGPGEPCRGNTTRAGIFSYKDTDPSLAICDTAQNLWCPPDTLVCTPTTSDGPCKEGKVLEGVGCLPSSSCRGSVCQPRLALGEACQRNADCVREAICRSGVCAERMADGEACFYNQADGDRECKLTCLCSPGGCMTGMCGSNLCQ